MSNVNVNTSEAVSEETVTPDTRVSPPTEPIPSSQTETEHDKYESATDPTARRKARATAKASHTRSLRAMNLICPITPVMSWKHSEHSYYDNSN